MYASDREDLALRQAPTVLEFSDAAPSDLQSRNTSAPATLRPERRRDRKSHDDLHHNGA